jgi:hypothetical protein
MAMRSFARAACLALLMAVEMRAVDNPPRTDTAKQQAAEAAKKAEAEQRRDAAQRLFTLQRLIWTEERGAATERLADRTDELLLDLVAGKTPTSEFNSQIETIDRNLVSIRRKAAHASVMGAARQGASPGDGRSFGAGFALLLSLGSLALSLFLYLRRRHVVEQTLRDAGLL